MKQITQLSDTLSGKVAIVRVDFNISLNTDNSIADYTRLFVVRDTIDYLLARNIKIILITHYKDPGIEVLHTKNKNSHRYSINAILPQLTHFFATQCNINVIFSDNNINENESDIIDLANRLKNRDVLLLENIRFYPEEKSNDATFAKKLAKLGHFYVNEAFSVSHREHASIDQLPRFLPAYAGIRFTEEISKLSTLSSLNQNGNTAIIGGKKVSDKFSLLHSLANKMDNIIVVGAMANSFLHAMGYAVSKSFYEDSIKEEILHLISQSKEHRCNIVIPQDVVITCDMSNVHGCYDCSTINNDIKEDYSIVDVGTKSLSQISNIIQQSKNVVWNGPAGLYENPKFITGTAQIAKMMSDATKQGRINTIIGGGDTLSAISMIERGLGMNLKATEGERDCIAYKFHDFTHISTGGGAFLAYLEYGEQMPGVRALYTNSS